MKRSNRVVIVGPTGCGKSVLARKLLAQQDQAIIVDPKHQWKPRKGDHLATNIKELKSALNKMRGEDGNHVVYRVPREHLLPQNAEFLDQVPALALERKNTLLFYDELVFVAGSSDFFRRAPNFYYAMTTGRGLGVGVWGLAQRPTWIPVIVFSESDYRATFYLRKRTDRARLEEFLGDEIPWGVLRAKKHSFVIGDDMKTSPPLRLSLQKEI